MKLLLIADVSPLEVLGGGERILREHALRLARRGHQVKVLCRAPERDASASASFNGVELIHVPAEPTRAWSWVLGAACRAGRMARKLAADLVIAYQPITAWGATRKRICPFVYIFLSPAGEEYRSRHPKNPVQGVGAALLHRIEDRVLARADRIVVLSQFTRDQLLESHNLSPADILQIPGGVDTDVFRPMEERSRIRRELELPVDSPLLVTVRNLVPRMGLDDLIRAMPVVHAQFPDATLVIGGEGPLRRELEGLAEGVGVSNRVRFLGYVPEESLPSLLAAADLFILPTRMLEGFGLVTVEALACGTPVIGTPAGATPELLQPLRAGLLLDGIGPSSLAQGILARLRANASNPQATEALRRACREHALSYNWERAIDVLESLARQLVPGPCPFCGTETARPVLRAAGGIYFGCARCGTLRRTPLPHPADLTRFYRDQYAALFLSGSDHPRRRAMFASLLRRLGPAGGRRLLDLGAGGGLFVRMARESGWKAEGTELSTDSRAWAETQHGVRLRDPLKEAPPPGPYDVVSLMNVLDQAPDPVGLLRTARSALRPDGRLLLRVPNAAIQARWIRMCQWLGLPRLAQLAVLHAYGFNPRSLRAVLLSQGFRLLRVRNAAFAGGAEAAAGSGLFAGLLRLTLRALAGSMAWLSRGRVLWGASLEAEAEILPEGGG